MKIGILANTNSWYANDLTRAAGNRHQITTLDFQDLASRIDRHEQAGIPGKSLDVVIVRSMPPGSLEQVIFRMDVLARWQAQGTRIVNSPKSLEAAIDKYLSLSLIKSAGINVPETVVVQTAEAAMDGFKLLGGDVVVKPIFGGEGRGMRRLMNPESARQTFVDLVADGSVIYLQRFLDHGDADYRIFVIGNDCYGMRRQNANDWRTNTRLGASCSAWQPSDKQTDIARSAARSVGADIAGVDLVVDRSGKCFVLEVNGVPGWRALTEATGIDIAKKVIEYLESGSPHPAAPVLFETNYGNAL